MSTRNRICWRFDELSDIARIDAGSNSRFDNSSPAVFLATHQSQPLHHLPRFGADPDNVIDEEQLLSAFQEPVGDDPAITVITGGVGTGKSHTVKWLHAQSIGRESWHQVYVEKANTNLRKVIETILEGMNGPVVVELREKLAQATLSVVDLPQAKVMVLHKLAMLAEFSSGNSSDRTEHESLARKHLPSLLNDPFLSKHLLRKGGAVHRISRIAIEGLKETNESELDVFFNEEDLPLEVSYLRNVAKPTQNAIRDLNANTPLRAAAVGVLNEELATAKKEVFVGSGINLTSVFDEVRKELAKRDLELVLYIEDLVLLHGIDRELAQVFTINRGENAERCAMRVVIAATQGYLASGFETLNTRASHYSLDLTLGAEAPKTLGENFVGTYFNALRIGSEGLQSSWSSRNNNDKWTPNGCEDCPEQVECHEVFGTDSEGRGLYPLNVISVERLIRLSSPNGKFDPREIIRHVIRDPLQCATEELPVGQFPSKNFASKIDGPRAAVPIEKKEKLKKTDVGQRELSVLAYWVDVANERTKAVYSAFGVSESEPGDGDTAFTSTEKESPAKPPETSGIDKEIADWVNENRTLSASTANEIRKFVFEGLMEQLRNGPSGLRVIKRGGHHWVSGIKVEPKCIEIKRAQGGGAELERHFKIDFDASDSNGVLFKKILLIQKSGSWSTDQLIKLIDIFDDASSRLAGLVDSRMVDIKPAVRLLSVTSQKRLSKDLTPGQLLEAQLREPEGFGESNSWTEWKKVVTEAHEESFNLLECMLSEAKGDGGSSVFDAAVVIEALNKGRSLRELKEPFKGSKESADLQRKLAEVQQRVGDKLWAEMHELLGAIGEFVADRFNLGLLTDQVDATLVKAKNAGKLPHADAYDEICDLAASLDDSCADSFSKLKRASDAENPSIFDLMPDQTKSLTSLRNYCQRASTLFENLQKQSHSSGEAASSGPTVSGLVTALQRMTDRLDSIAGGGK